MEDTLWAEGIRLNIIYESLNPCFNGRYSQRRRIDATGATARTVLILVLMEDTLRAVIILTHLICHTSLNPCFNGRYSQRAEHRFTPVIFARLNPCFNGRYSQRFESVYDRGVRMGLNPCFNGRYSQRRDMTWIWMRWRS